MVKERIQYWLMKSEPSVYSIEDFKKERKTLWTGVRNYQARNFMMQPPSSLASGEKATMQPGDLFLFYHSNADPTGVAGVGRIKQVGLPDPSQFEKSSELFEPRATKAKPIWFCAECEFVEQFSRIVELSELRSDRKLTELLVLKKGMRLSVQPVSQSHFKHILTKAQS